MIREKNMTFYEERIRESELQIKVFDCTQRAVIGWKGKEKWYDTAGNMRNIGGIQKGNSRI